MTLSKNIQEERESPAQLLLYYFCPLLNLRIFLRLLHLLDYIFMVIVQAEVLKMFYKIFIQASHLQQFILIVLELTSERLLQPMQATLGCLEIGQGLMDDGEGMVSYININFPYPDACVVSILCSPQGPCKYTAKEGCVISNAILRQ